MMKSSFNTTAGFPIGSFRVLGSIVSYIVSPGYWDLMGSFPYMNDSMFSLMGKLTFSE